MVTRHPKYAELSGRAAKVYGVLWGLGSGLEIDDQGRQVIRVRKRVRDYINDDGEYKPGLASLCGYKSTRPIEQALNELENIGWLERRRTGRASFFTIIVPIERQIGDAENDHDERDDTAAEVDSFASDAHAHAPEQVQTSASDALIRYASTVQIPLSNQNQTTTTATASTDEPTDTGIADVGGGGRSLDEVEAELRTAGIGNPATLRQLAQRDDITPEVIREIRKKNPNAGGGLIATILNDPKQVATTRAAKLAATAEARAERKAAEERAEQERQRREAEAEAQAQADDAKNTKIIAKLVSAKGHDYITDLHREANEQTSGFFHSSSITGANGKARQLRACVVGIVAERCREHLRGLPPELVAEAAGTAPESVPTWISNTNDTDAIKAASKATKLNTTTANA